MIESESDCNSDTAYFTDDEFGREKSSDWDKAEHNEGTLLDRQTEGGR